MPPLLDKLGRVLLPLLTPFDERDEVNRKALGDLVEHVITKGYCDSLIATGSTGEFYALSPEERTLVLETVKEANAGRVPLIAGTGAAATRDAIGYTREAERLGYDCVMVVVPYYQRATQEGFYQHFRAVAAETTLPVVVYNVPIFTGVNLEAETLGRLVRDVPNILGIKEEAGLNPTQTSEYKLVVGDEFTIFCGDDTMVLQTFPQGAVGVVSGGAHVIGDLMGRMMQLHVAGKVEEASSLYLETFPLFRSLVPPGRVNPIPVLKTVVTLTSGIDLGSPRLPSLGATEEELAAIKPVLRSLGRLPAGA
jgi:4-hydroxy-tetrahydrodipicolinate synthase